MLVSLRDSMASEHVSSLKPRKKMPICHRNFPVFIFPTGTTRENSGKLIPRENLYFYSTLFYPKVRSTAFIVYTVFGHLMAKT